ncbi:MAG: hypothetical protein KAJ55_03325 [Anaerolineales bacterium]|nr:hypothetical protein [Anaerolineales bacterium]
MSGRLSVTEKAWLKARVGQEFEPILNGLRDRLIPLKVKFTDQLYRTLGLAAAERNILKMVKDLERLNAQYEAIAGVECVDITTKTTPGQVNGYSRWNDTPFAREVDAKVKATKEARHLVEAETKCQHLQDQVMLAGFPEQLVELIEKELPKATGQYAKLLTNGNGHHQLGA